MFLRLARLFGVLRKIFYSPPYHLIRHKAPAVHLCPVAPTGQARMACHTLPWQSSSAGKRRTKTGLPRRSPFGTKTGDERVRTADLLVANQTLSQLSYVPFSIADCGFQIADCKKYQGRPLALFFLIRNLQSAIEMGPVGFEPTTSPLSGARSSQLSYEPFSISNCQFPIENTNPPME